MWTSNQKKYFVLLFVVLMVGLILGLFFLQSISKENQELILSNIGNNLINNNEHINNIIPHILILSLFIILSFFVIGMPIYIFYIFYNGFSLGFIINTITRLFGFKGFIYSLIYILGTKIIDVLGSIILIFFLIRIGEKVFKQIIKKNQNEKDNIIKLFKKSLIVLLLIFINDLIIYFWGAKFLNFFKFFIN